MEINVIRDNDHAESSQARDNQGAYMMITDIVSQHVEAAAFLWLLRSHAAGQPHCITRMADDQLSLGRLRLPSRAHFTEISRNAIMSDSTVMERRR